VILHIQYTGRYPNDFHIHPQASRPAAGNFSVRLMLSHYYYAAVDNLVVRQLKLDDAAAAGGPVRRCRATAVVDRCRRPAREDLCGTTAAYYRPVLWIWTGAPAPQPQLDRSRRALKLDDHGAPLAAASTHRPAARVLGLLLFTAQRAAGCCDGEPCSLPQCQHQQNCIGGPRVSQPDANGGRELFDRVCLGAGTESAFSGQYDDERYLGAATTGVYRCGCCGHTLFHSAQIYDSGTGWPSFFAPRLPGSVECPPPPPCAPAIKFCT
jgi:hypothetical protein